MWGGKGKGTAHLLIHKRDQFQGDLGVYPGDLEAVGEGGEGAEEVFAVAQATG